MTLEGVYTPSELRQMDAKREAALQRDVDHARTEQVRIAEKFALMQHRVGEIADDLERRGQVTFAKELRAVIR